MRKEAERDLAVDVLVIGGGIPALYIARSLHPLFTVCVVSEPGVPYESFESPGRFSAGYTGNDVPRIQPARRAAGWWRLWAESHGVPHDPGPSMHVLRPEDEASVTRRWGDAGLAFDRVEGEALPPALADGSVTGRPIYATPDDVVMDPGRVAAQLRAGLDDRVVAATVVRFGLITPQAIDFVELELPDRTIVPVAPRYVVLASDGANGALVHRVAMAIKDRARRREAVELARASQAVRRRTTILVRGELPRLSLHVEGTDITALPVGDGAGDDVLWVVQLPVDDAHTVTGPDDLRFAPPVDAKAVAEGLGLLFELCPSVARRADELRWAAHVARQTEHPMVTGGADTARPVPARIETLGMDALAAVWPSQLAYSMIVGDVVAERVRKELGGPVPADGLSPAELPRPAAEATTDLWQRPGFAMEDWAGFGRRFGAVH